jgi:hypothetical protein
LTLPDGPFKGAEELLEQWPGVVGARRGLRMILDSENREGSVPKAFDGPIVQIDVGDFQIRRTLYRLLVSFDGKAVVLRRDQDSARLDFLYRVISAAVSVRHLRRRATEGKS